MLPDKEYLKNSLQQKRNIILDNRYLMDYVFIPISKKLEIDVNELIDIFLKHYDEADLYELTAYVEQARMACLGRKVDIDLGLCWLADFLKLISRKEADQIRKEVVELHLLYKKPYKEALKIGKEKLKSLLVNKK